MLRGDVSMNAEDEESIAFFERRNSRIERPLTMRGRLTYVYRMVHQSQGHCQPVQHFSLFLDPTLGERLVHDAQQYVGRQCAEGRWCVLGWKGRRAEGAGLDIGRRWWKHECLLVKDDHVA